MAEPVAVGLRLPTSIAFDERGRVYVAESGLPLAGAPRGGRVLRLNADGASTCVAADLREPVNGLSCHGLTLYIAEGGKPGRISALELDGGRRRTVLDGLPGGGNYHTSMAVIGADGWLYFGQGALTNSGIVGPDALMLSWLGELPHPHDIPGRDVSLSGWNATTAGEAGECLKTGPFQPFGHPSHRGQRIPGRLPCTAAVMRCRPDGSELELVAWGLRNPYGLAFDRHGRLLAIDLGINDRGGRPVGQVPDCLFHVRPGRWYGWPDYAAGRPVNDPRYAPARGPRPEFLLTGHDRLGAVEPPLHAFPVNAAPTKLACEPGGERLIVALFGDKRPMSAPPGPRVGRAVVRLDPVAGVVETLASPPFERPIDVAFGPDGDLYVLDFGRYEMRSMTEFDVDPASGALYRFRNPRYR